MRYERERGEMVSYKRVRYERMRNDVVSLGESLLPGNVRGLDVCVYALIVCVERVLHECGVW